MLRDPNNPSTGYIPFHQRVYDVSQLTTSSRAGEGLRPLRAGRLAAGRPSLDQRRSWADWIRTDDLLFGQNIQKGWNVGPRLGFTYQLTKDHMNVVRGSFAIVHDMPQSIYIASAGTNSAGYTDYYDNNLDGTYEMVLTTPASNKLNPAYQFDPNFHQPKIREYVLGYGRQFPGQLSFNATVIRRDYLDRWARVDVNSIYDGNVFVGYENPAQNAIYLNTNNIWNWFVTPASSSPSRSGPARCSSWPATREAGSTSTGPGSRTTRPRSSSRRRSRTTAV